MKKAVKIILFLLVLAAAAAYGYYTLTAPLNVTLTTVRAGDVELSFSAQGLSVAGNVVSSYPLTQGKLAKLNVAEGDFVNAGDVLCEIDSGALKLQYEQAQSVTDSYLAQIANLDAEREKITAELSAGRARLVSEIAVIDAQDRNGRRQLETLNLSVNDKLRLQDVLIEQSGIDLSRARSEMDKALELYESGSITRGEYESAADYVKKCESALKATELEREVIEGGRGAGDADFYAKSREALETQIAGIDESLKKDYTGAMKDYYNALIEANKLSAEQILRQIGDCLVTAPVGGVITKLYILNANYINLNAPVAEITEPGDNVIEAYVSTNDVDYIKMGDTVGLTLKRRSGDVSFTGAVIGIGDTAEARLSALGVEERGVKITVAPNTEELGGVSFGLGYEAEVRFYVYRAENKLAVPKTALYKDAGRDMIWVVREGKAETAEVVKGVELRSETVIDSGISEGELVVTDANNKDLAVGTAVATGG